MDEVRQASPPSERGIDPVPLFLEVIGEYLDEGWFDLAAEKVILISKAFDVRGSLFPFLEERLGKLSRPDFHLLIGFLTQESKKAKRVIEKLGYRNQSQNLNRFFSLLADYLGRKSLGQAEEGNQIEAAKCLGEALQLLPADKKLTKTSKILGRQAREVGVPHDLEPLVNKLTLLTSKYPLPHSMYPYDANARDLRKFDEARVAKPRKAVYRLGQHIVISISPPRDGYLTLFRYDAENNLEMLFPHKINDVTFVKAGKGKKIGIKAKKPLGRHYLKTVWSSAQLIDSEQISFIDESSIASTIESFIDSLRALPPDAWMQSVDEFEVVEN